jgi:hypothetical protein
VPVMVPAAPGRRAGKPEAGLRFAWLGRLVDFKAPILAHVMDRLDAMAAQRGPVSLTVIGEGDEAEALRLRSQRLTHLQTSFVADIPVERLNEYLVANVDVMFAMGTSALDTARLGIPTFLVDYSFQPVRGTYRFRLIDEAEGFSLGEEITASKLEQESSLEASIATIAERYQEASDRSYQYWLDTHSPTAVTQVFEDAVRATTATVGGLRELGAFTPDLTSRVVLTGWNAAIGRSGSAGFGTL